MVPTDLPAQAELLCAFANTLDVDIDADPPEALPDAAALTDWLRGRNLIDVDDLADSGDLDLALTLRSGVREAMVRHSEGDRHVPGARPRRGGRRPAAPGRLRRHPPPARSGG